MVKVTGAAAALAVAVTVVVPPTAQSAGAGGAWSQPQEVSTGYGRQVSLSGDGATAAWIAAKDIEDPGMVTTSVHLRSGRWSKPRVVTGTAESTEVTVSGDGSALLVKGPAGCSVVPRASRNLWSPPELIAQVTLSAPPQGWWGLDPALDPLALGRISADGGTVVWVDGSQNAVAAGPVLVKSRTRGADGSWGSPTVVFPSLGRPRGGPRLTKVEVSASGALAVWQSGEKSVLSASRTPSGWSEPDYVAQGRITAMALAPDGRVVAFGRKDPDRMQVRRFRAGRWTRPVVLGPAEVPGIAMTGTTVAWLESDPLMTFETRRNGSALRVSTLSGGRWSKARLVDRKAVQPALSASTLAWRHAPSRRIVAVSR